MKSAMNTPGVAASENCFITGVDLEHVWIILEGKKRSSEPKLDDNGKKAGVIELGAFMRLYYLPSPE